MPIGEGSTYDSTIVDAYNPTTGELDGVDDRGISNTIAQSNADLDEKIEQLRIDMNNGFTSLSDRLDDIENKFAAGYDGTVTISGTTLTISDGLITNVT